MALQQPDQLLVGEPDKHLAEPLAAPFVDLLEDPGSCRGGMHEDDAPVVRIVATFHESPVDHPVHDPGHARDRDIELLGEAAHRQRSLGLEQRQDVEVDQAERTLLPAPEMRDELARIPGRELDEDGLDELLMRLRRRVGLASRPADSQCHIANLRHANRSGKRP